MRRRLLALPRRLRSQGGFTMVELLASMTILGTVMGGLTGLMVSGTKAQIDMSRRFQAQTEARLALDLLRREVHCASSSTAANGVAVATVTLTLSTACPTAAGSTSATWCTVANGSYYGLWRYTGGSCSGTGRKVADFLTTQLAFTYSSPSGSTALGTGQLAFLAIALDVNVTPAKAERVYSLADRIVFRNSTRPA